MVLDQEGRTNSTCRVHRILSYPWHLTADQIPDLNPTHCFMGRLDRCFLTPSPLTFTWGLVLLFSSHKELALSTSLETTVGPAASAHGPIKSTKWNEHQNLMMLASWNLQCSYCVTVIFTTALCMWPSVKVGQLWYVVGKVALHHMVLLPASTFTVCRAIVVYTH